MKKEFEFRAITYNEYLDLKNNINNSTDMIIEIEGKKTKKWSDFTQFMGKIFNFPFNCNSRAFASYIEDWFDFENVNIKKVYIFIFNIDECMRRKGLEKILYITSTQFEKNYWFYTLFPVEILPRTLVSLDVINTKTCLEEFKVFYVNDKENKSLPYPQNRIIYLSDNKYDSLRRKLSKNSNQLVIDLTDKNTEGSFLQALHPYIGVCESLQSLENKLIHALYNPSTPSNIAFFLKNFSRYDFESNDRIIVYFLIKYCMCYWFYYDDYIKKEITFYVTENW